MTGFRYALKPLPPGWPDWLKLTMRIAVEVTNDANALRYDWFGLPPAFLVDPSIAELRPLAITDGTERRI